LSCNLAQKQSKLYHSSRASRNFCSAAITASESAKRAACSPELSQEPSLESAQGFAAARVSQLASLDRKLRSFLAQPNDPSATPKPSRRP